jgi:hypothetical protein
MTTLFYKIPPHLPFSKGGTVPLFGKEGRGEILIHNYDTVSEGRGKSGRMWSGD